MKSNKFVLSFPKIEAIESTALICFSDASFGNLKCGGSQAGLELRKKQFREENFDNFNLNV